MKILRHVRLSVAAGTIFLLLLAAADFASAAGRAKAGIEAAEPPISALIRQLGDEQYSVRQQAQEELARLGADAFDALVTAELNDDIEIATRAAYLVHLIRIDWVRDSDSQQVKELLRDYENQPEDVRRQAMLSLAESLRNTGLEPLCRLIRFERRNCSRSRGHSRAGPTRAGRIALASTGANHQEQPARQHSAVIQMASGVCPVSH